MFRNLFQKKEKGRILKLAQGVEMEFVRVPAGEFLMGSTDDQIEQLLQEPVEDNRMVKPLLEEAKPQHSLYLPEYWIGKTPVTIPQFEAFTNATRYKTQAEKDGAEFNWQMPRGRGVIIFNYNECPVVYVNWLDALAFCEWASKFTGVKFLLPSEAEWEKAARGTDGRLYPWGNVWDSRRAHTLESRTSPSLESVGTLPMGASPYGALDMAGNVREWTSSLYESYPYNPGDGRENMASDEILRITRGGSRDQDLLHATCAYRSADVFNLGTDEIGFRCVLPASA